MGLFLGWILFLVFMYVIIKIIESNKPNEEMALLRRKLAIEGDFKANRYLTDKGRYYLGVNDDEKK
ncbi:TPA: hypothetical protein I1665_000402 [Staphylococcus pseudintermedius]|nr:hypothetical protein [Staphylococcus pseudintermedius]